ncbi:hypothetical protein LLH23_19255 [bacterium]|nr:hypothetical protein [bacterium]
MSKHVPLLVVAAVLLITVGAIYLGMRHSQEPADTAPPGPPAPVAEATKPQPGKAAPGLAVEGAKIEQRDPQGQLEWSVIARGELEFDKDQQTVTGRNVQFEMTSKAKMPCILQAPVFHADYAAKVLTFDEGVYGRMTEGGATFKVNHVVYNFSTQKLVGSGGARFVQGQYVATAREIVVDPKAKKVRLRGGVRFERRG